jgi:hypothetical protein
MIGGVSIGSFVSGLYGIERNIVTVTQKAREWSRVKRSKFTVILENDYKCTIINVRLFDLML